MQSDDLNMSTEWRLIVETGSPAVLGYSPVRPETLRRHLSMVLPMWRRYQSIDSSQTIGVKVSRYFLQRMKTKWGGCNHWARTVAA